MNLQPRNVLWKIRDGALSASGQLIRDLILCDMDATTKIGELKLKGLKISEGYMAPEMATYLQVRQGDHRRIILLAFLIGHAAAII